MSVTEVVAKAWRLRGRLVRFAGVSVVGVVITQALLLLFAGGLDWAAVLANIVATTLAALPVFLLNRRWVWGKKGQHSVSREIVPFWSYTLLGLAVSTGLVAVASAVWGQILAVMAANLLGWGVLWLGKFVLLERYLFRDGDEVAPGRRVTV
ncbi:MAG: hypothetical protein GY708_25345 [Actinomycetia bacterium]|nr:hypothetical protein [Actinomycetes bacterium]